MSQWNLSHTVAELFYLSVITTLEKDLQGHFQITHLKIQSTFCNECVRFVYLIKLQNQRASKESYIKTKKNKNRGVASWRDYNMILFYQLSQYVN